MADFWSDGGFDLGFDYDMEGGVECNAEARDAGGCYYFERTSEVMLEFVHSDAEGPRFDWRVTSLHDLDMPFRNDPPNPRFFAQGVCDGSSDVIGHRPRVTEEGCLAIARPKAAALCVRLGLPVPERWMAEVSQQVS